MAKQQRALISSVLVGLAVLVCAVVGQVDPIEEARAQAYLEEIDIAYSEACNTQMVARWTYITNVTTENEEESTRALNEFLAFQAAIQANISAEWPNWATASLSETTKREFRFMAARGPAETDPTLVEEMNGIMATMESSYATAKVCTFAEKDFPDCVPSLSLEPDLEDKLRTVTDYNELSYYWTAWHNAMKSNVQKANYTRFIELQNMIARNISSEYKNMGDLWAIPYDDGSQDWTAAKFEDEMLQIWESLRPNYEKLHAYVRMKLRENDQYKQNINKFGPIPANLLGNMWAQDWTALDSRTKPFPDAPSLDATAAMKAAGYDAMKMFQVSDEFFTGLGLLPMTDTFWRLSMLEKPTDREVVCHASAEDFCLRNSEDFRIKMCTEVNQDDLVTVHHEMGHIEYFMQYNNLHYIFREGANPGFHEAIGDALALAVTTPAHLQCALRLNLSIPNLCEGNRRARMSVNEVTETDLNFLYYMALQKYSFFPFAISMDSWRWGVFDGSISESQYNSKWWEIREQNQGIMPPAPRGDNVNDPDDGLDAAAKYHIVANVEYIRYFVSHILQFQFYEALCIAAGEYDPDNSTSKPLYQCDFAGSQEAGKLFQEMMQLGFSKPWPDALEAITGSRQMNTTALNNYFQPLLDYIDEQLTSRGEAPGWSRAYTENEAAQYVAGMYEQNMTNYCYSASLAEFMYQTNLTSQEAENASLLATFEWAQFEAQEYTNTIIKFDYEKFANKNLSRTFKFLNAIGTSKLPASDFEQYSQVLSEMSKIYGTAKVCPYNKQNCNLASEGLPLEPDLTEILSKTSPTNQDEMAYYWKAWRDASGKKMRTLYGEFVDYSNKAAELNGVADMGEFWLLRYESETFREDLEEVWQEVNEKLYKPFFAYVRHRLIQEGFKIDPEGPIGAHLLGNMWAQTWEYIMPYVSPNENETVFDITPGLQQMTGTVTSPKAKATILFNMANTFFVETGLEPMYDAYSDKAMIVKPDDGREVICHASAWDMCKNGDHRIKMCTEINQENFITIHHELGHIQYYKQYANLQYTHRTGANPGFHEAIGDVLALSVSSPQHLKTIGLLDGEPSEASMLNFLMQQALDKVAFLPFGYLIDSYRWRIFSGNISRDEWEYEWVKMRGEYQGVAPPVLRSEDDFDPGAKYHVPANTPYIRYFVSYILQFQVQKKLCEVANHTGPLYECDIYRNRAAGKLFAEIMGAGASLPWTELLQSTVGTDKLDPAAIIEYFQPLLEFFNKTQAEENYSDNVIFNVDDYITEPGQTTPSEAPDTGAPGSSTEPSSDTTTTASGSEGTTSEASTEKEEEEGKSVALIVVGIVVGVILLVIVVGYVCGKKICRK